MKYLQILNYILLALGFVIALVMSVVTLIMALYQEQASQIGGNVGIVAAVTVIFLIFAAVAALTTWAVYKRYPWMWAAQISLFLVLGVVVQFLRYAG